MIDYLQWPGMAFGLVGAIFVSGRDERARFIGFALWIVSNLCWIVWSLDAKAWGLLAMQVPFCATSALGCWNNREWLRQLK